MLDIISDGFKKAKEKLTGTATLSEENLKEAIESIRTSLLEADVEYGVTKDFLKGVYEKALGQKVHLKAGASGHKMRVSPADHFIKICHEELVGLMGEADSSVNFAVNRPTVIMMVGLQGSGKTTTTGKLTQYLIKKFSKKPLLVAADIYRPAAVNQLQVLGGKLSTPVFHVQNTKPAEMCRQALLKAYEHSSDVIIIDTAGRLTIDSDLMTELDDIKLAVKPDHIFFVCDSMMGQDAVTTAKAFNDRLDLSGVIMTKLDGDARGGAALSIRRITGKPIKFLGMGESLDKLEEFRPEGLASRILGMGDIVGLMEDFEKVHKGDVEADMLKMLEGQFNFKDFYEQLSMIQRMGSLKDIMAKLPMQNLIPKDVQLDDKEFVRIKAMIDSMTEKERLNPSLFNESRVRRIAKGSGTKSTDVMDMIKRFKSMRTMMGSLGKGLGGMMGKIPGMGGLNQLNQMRQMAQNMMRGGGGLPAGFPGGGLGGMGDMFGGLGGGSASVDRKVDRDKLKKLRKQAKDARKKNRK
jgi:signal recognition particle subunit SRP54